MSDKVKTSITGYGLVFKRVMKDTNIDIEAKALYSYLSAYAGSSETAFPGVNLICHELNISDKRFKKYRKQLEDNGYLSVERERTNNGFSKNIYTIEHNPVSGNFVPVQNFTGRNVTGQNVGTTINSSTINNNTNNSKTINNSATDVTREHFEEWWKLYNKKRDKKISYKKFEKCLKKHSFEQIMQGTREYLKTITNKQFQKDPKTFLHNESYMNDYSDELPQKTSNQYTDAFERAAQSSMENLPF
ncbi:helix-turn-helix domain-containing protein [Staphylococcus haemolyticus]|uniref:helix-turn-helix domain-containing protein n=1 Tax=Staphylococcus haemolyticus TaxID=1283 RepID=UPI00066E70DF|nr:helix-turn-helix domain-containing protein [Staphylococcus haemolyticus]MCC3714759.1 helix-turn-helix domain-containing protein [Staphylococcus haemolyticus]MCH4321420.1 helix-turn-helix domain-containing protein [Staphylococcus haemolyticus]PJM59718.1 helix-turn-helix domain-containing protein [Staphylococcus haemolyticus]